jgi:hypothetical protein
MALANLSIEYPLSWELDVSMLGVGSEHLWCDVGVEGSEDVLRFVE